METVLVISYLVAALCLLYTLSLWSAVYMENKHKTALAFSGVSPARNSSNHQPGSPSAARKSSAPLPQDQQPTGFNKSGTHLNLKLPKQSADELYLPRMIVLGVSVVTLFFVMISPAMTWYFEATCPEFSIMDNLLYSLAKYTVFLFLFKKQRIVQFEKAMTGKKALSISEIVLLVLMSIYIINMIIYSFFLAKFHRKEEYQYLCLPEENASAAIGVAAVALLTQLCASFGLLVKFIQPLKKLIHETSGAYHYEQQGTTFKMATVDQEASSRTQQLKRILRLNKKSCVVFVGTNLGYCVGIGILNQPLGLSKWENQQLSAVITCIDIAVGVTSVIMCSPQLWRFVPGIRYIAKPLGIEKDILSKVTDVHSNKPKDSVTSGADNAAAAPKPEENNNAGGSLRQSDSNIKLVAVVEAVDENKDNKMTTESNSNTGLVLPNPIPSEVALEKVRSDSASNKEVAQSQEV